MLLNPYFGEFGGTYVPEILVPALEQFEAEFVAAQQDPAFHAESYFQVFSDRLPFAPNLSVADLLFAEGPDAAELLRRSFR